MIEGTRKGRITWTRRLMMPFIIVLVAVVLWSRGTSSEEAKARVQGMVEVFLETARSDSEPATGDFLEREALRAISELGSPRSIGPVEDLSDHLGQRCVCSVSGSTGRSVRLEFSGNPPSLQRFDRIPAE
ncbi:MAG: hypothetical protein MK085_04450 [Phycisphaerales bacterium]|nr:hypothetical protein [Phycisphaerales bacterium]